MTALRPLVVLFVLTGVAVGAEPKRDRHGDPLPDGAVARLGTIQAHPGVRSIAFTPDGQTLITTGDMCVRYWDVNSGRIKKFIEAGRIEIEEHAISSDGRIMVGLTDTRIEVVGIQSGKLLF